MAPLKTISQEASEAITSARNPGGSRYLLVSALIGYQSIQNLLPDILLVLGRDAFLSPLLNGRQPMLEGVHVAWRAAFTS
jgi:hypothetical protein